MSDPQKTDENAEDPFDGLPEEEMPIIDGIDGEDGIDGIDEEEVVASREYEDAVADAEDPVWFMLQHVLEPITAADREELASVGLRHCEDAARCVLGSGH